MCKWHILLGLIGGIADHQTLITRTDVFLSFINMNRLGNFVGLLIHGNHDGCSFAIHSQIDIGVANFLDCLSYDLLEVDICSGVDLSENHAERVFD